MSNGLCLAIGLLAGYTLERIRWKRIRQRHGNVEIKLNDPFYNGHVDELVRAVREADQRIKQRNGGAT